MGSKMVLCVVAVLAGWAAARAVLGSDAPQRIPGDATLKELREALGKLSGAARVSAINSLGLRRDAAATAQLADLLDDEDAETVGASLTALGRIASPEAADVLLQAGPGAPLTAVLHDAQFRCAERLAEGGDVSRAAELYRLIWSSNRAMAWRLSGLAGLVRVDGERAAPMVLEAMGSEDPFCREMAARLGRQLPEGQMTDALARRLAEFDDARQVLLKRSEDAGRRPRAEPFQLLGVLTGPDAYPALLERAKTQAAVEAAPVEPDLAGSQFDICRYGAQGGGTQDNAPFIQKALDAAHEKGGGTVYIPPGTYHSSTVLLKSNTTLFLAKGAILKAIGDAGAYADDTPHLILAREARHVALVGRGTIDGNGFAFWKPETKPHQWVRPLPKRVSPLIFLDACTDVLVRDVQLKASPGWTLKIGHCDRARVLNIDIDNYLYGPNTDGIDICDSRDVQVIGCRVQTGDDAVVIKADTRSSEHILVSECLLRSHCAAFKLGTGSACDFRDIQFRDSIVHQSNRVVGLYSRDGGVMEDISVYNISGDTNCGMRLSRPIHIDLCKRTPQSKAGTIRRVVFRNMRIATEGRILMTNADGGHIEDIQLRDIELRYPLIVTPDDNMKNARSGQFSTHSPEARVAAAAVVADGIENLNIRDLVIHWPKEDLPAHWLVRGSSSPEIPPSDEPVFRVERSNEPFHVLWGRHLKGGTLDLPSAAPFGRARKYHLTDCNINALH